MDKMAIFVEGQTERIFLEMCICEVAGRKGLCIQSKQITGGTKAPRTISLLNTIGNPASAEKFFLIYDCGNDELVKSRILEEYSSLSSSGYSKILGVRDLYPIEYRDLGRLEQGLCANLPSTNIEIFVAVMETESWFLACYPLFCAINKSLDTAAIKTILGFDPSVYDLELVRRPSKSINRIFRRIGLRYQKKKSEVQSIVDKIDYADLYLRVRYKFNNLNRLFASIDSFL